MTVYMPDTDYKAICDATREKCGTTGLLKSYEIKPLLAALETGGAKFTLTVNVDSGSTVVATKGGLSVSGTATNGVCVLELPEAGEWMVTASLDGQSASGVVNVVGEYAVEAVFLPPIGTPLNDMSWADISKVAKAGLASQYFSVGDRKQVVLNGTVGGLTLSNYTTYCYIIGINHNAELEGYNLIHFQLAKTALSGGTDIALCDSKYGATEGSDAGFRMNTSATNEGGWNASYMRKTICPAFKNALPIELKNVIASVVKHTNNTGNSQTADAVTATIDEIFLLAEYEASGVIRAGNNNEASKQMQYDYYSAGNEKVKYKHTSITTGVAWRLRSPGAAYNGFLYMGNDGSVYSESAAYSLGFAPAFCVGGA